MQTGKNYVRCYEGSYQFFSKETDLNISPDYAQMKLAQQYEYRATKEELWAEILQDGVVSRYVLDYENIMLNKVS